MTTNVEEALILAMNKADIRDPVTRNGIMAIAVNEGGFGALHPEHGYGNTANSRIREIFGSRVASLTDAELDALKADDRRFFNFVYDGANPVGKQLGNQPGTDDGYHFRGRGPVQITGRSNYERYTRLAGYPEVMQDVELVDDPVVGAAMTVVYVLDQYKGGGFEQLMAIVGNNIPDIAARKRASFAQFMAAHTYDYGAAPSPPQTAARPTLRYGASGEAVVALQIALSVPWLPADGAFGPATQNVVKAFQYCKRITDDGIVGPQTWTALDIELSSS